MSKCGVSSVGLSYPIGGKKLQLLRPLFHFVGNK